MNFKKVEKAAKKINQLLDNMRDEEQVSKIEKDLLLSYIRDLYEKATQTKESSKKENAYRAPKSDVAQSPISNPVAEIKAPTPPAVEIADVVRQEIQEITNQPVPTPIQKQVEPSSSIQNNTPAEVIQVEELDLPKTSAPQELLELFEKGSVAELSDKLSQSPISDLTKCMGINERIFTVNELFSGDTGLFNSTMQELDKLNSLEQARDYLVNDIAVRLNWGDGSKIKKTANFVKLISRRY